MCAIIRLKNNKLVLREHGKSRIVTLPRGVTLPYGRDCWRINILVEGKWTSAYVDFSAGLYASYQQALKLRRENIGVLLHRRVLGHQIRDIPPTEHKGQYYVYDPIDQEVLTTAYADEVPVIREYVVERWVDAHEFLEEVV